VTADIARLLRVATYASVATAGLLIIAKSVAWLATDSVSILASLVDSLMDAAASLLNLLAVRWSLMPADEEHRFGHGKAEALAGLGQATFITGSAVFLVLQAIDRLLHPQPLTQIGVGVTVILLSMVATMLLLGIQRHVIRRTQSTAIRADALHYASDLATSGATLAALLLSQAGWSGMDPLFALAIAAYILYSALHIALDAVRLLMDRELPEGERDRVAAVAAGTPGVLGVHGLRTRQSGRTKVIQLHLELADDLPLIEAHRVSMLAEARLRRDLPDADITIHEDPASLGTEGDGVETPASELTRGKPIRRPES